MQFDSVILVDENDNEIGVCEKIKAHEKALLHRAFSIFVYQMVDGQLQVLLQKRNSHKYHCGGLWTNTCCSHPLVNKTIIESAKLRLQQEMGFAVELMDVGHLIYKAEFANGLTEYELDHVLIGQYNNEPINPNKAEVEDFKWLSIDAIKEDLRNHANCYTPWFEKAFDVALASS